MSIKIIQTEDGSHSLFDEGLNETYHSTRGAKGESLHVFIKEGLEYIVESQKPSQVNILEVGFGTGLNAFLSGLYAEEHNVNIHFHTLEPFPVVKEIYQALNYANTKEEQVLFQRLHSTNWDEDITISDYFLLKKSALKLEDYHTEEQFDVLFFDAFAPSKQPEVWSIDNLRNCYQLLKKGGVLTTYCAQGQFKRNLLDVGFEIETLQGAMGKKEMVRAKK